MLKRLLLLTLAFTAFGFSQCLDNCGVFIGGCEMCHNMTGPAIDKGDQGPGTPYPGEPAQCAGCSMSAAVHAPKFAPSVPGKDIVALVNAFLVKPEPKWKRLMETAPERHVALMERAYKLKLDGPLLGRCNKAFATGTLILLPAEIEKTRTRLTLAQAKK